jgi:glucose-6-phosphate-specific signal transduction histidine kinase
VNPRRLPARSWLSLTDTERAVAYLAAQGLSSRVVADRMRLPRPTVHSHLRRVFRKLHANAEMVEVSVEADRGVLSLSVRDDGVGGADPDGSGLTGIRERAEALGGTLKLTSPPGHGTSVDVRLPAPPGLRLHREDQLA